jgi:hypothetical protein
MSEETAMLAGMWGRSGELANWSVIGLGELEVIRVKVVRHRSRLLVHIGSPRPERVDLQARQRVS